VLAWGLFPTPQFFTTLEAAEAAARTSRNCRGITYEGLRPSDDKYTLRQGGVTEASPNSEISWVFRPAPLIRSALKMG
jgi:hypothetical protein